MTEQEKREKVIKGLECCDGYCDEDTGCPYFESEEGFECVERLTKDAIDLLKAQEPRVMVPENFNENPERDEYGNLPCWLESREPFIASGWNRWNEDDFIRPQMRNFRPWTSRPTDEQRQAVKWE